MDLSDYRKEIDDIDKEITHLFEKRMDVSAKVARYKIERVFEDPLDTLDAIARKRGCLMSGGHIDYNRIAVILLDEFRGGKIGNISLERVDDVLDEEENEGEV